MKSFQPALAAQGIGEALDYSPIPTPFFDSPGKVVAAAEPPTPVAPVDVSFAVVPVPVLDPAEPDVLLAELDAFEDAEALDFPPAVTVTVSVPDAAPPAFDPK